MHEIEGNEKKNVSLIYLEQQQQNKLLVSCILWFFIVHGFHIHITDLEQKKRNHWIYVDPAEMVLGSRWIWHSNFLFAPVA